MAVVIVVLLLVLFLCRRINVNYSHNMCLWMEVSLEGCWPFSHRRVPVTFRKRKTSSYSVCIWNNNSCGSASKQASTDSSVELDYEPTKSLLISCKHSFNNKTNQVVDVRGEQMSNRYRLEYDSLDSTMDQLLLMAQKCYYGCSNRHWRDGTRAHRNWRVVVRLRNCLFSRTNIGNSRNCSSTALNSFPEATIYILRLRLLLRLYM